MKQEELDSIYASMAETSQRILAIKTKSEEAALKIASLTLDYTVSCIDVVQARTNLILSSEP